MSTNIGRVEEITFNRINRENLSDSFGRDNCSDKYEIIYVASGSGKYRIEGSEFAVAPRSLILIKPFAYYFVEFNQSNFEIYSLKFSKTALSTKATDLLEKKCENKRGCYYSPTMLSGAIISVFDRFEIAETLDKESAEEFKRALLSEIIILLSAVNGEEMSTVEGELGARVAEYLNRNIERDLSLDRLAKRFFVSKYHLCRAFKIYTGISVHSYINHKRIMYAKQLIESGMTASGAAERVGFGDYSAFYRAYVKIVGKSPTSN